MFCDDLDIDHVPYAKLVEQQITQQVHDQTGVALFPLLSEEEEAEHVEKDWRVVINVSEIATLPCVGTSSLTCAYPRPRSWMSRSARCI